MAFPDLEHQSVQRNPAADKIVNFSLINLADADITGRMFRYVHFMVRWRRRQRKLIAARVRMGLPIEVQS